MRRKEKTGPAGTAERMVDRVAAAVTHWAGSSWGFGMAAGTVLVWGITGPLFRWSDTWQLVINTGTTIVTFLMVFLVQRTQNRDGLAIQLKLNEIVAAVRGASNRLIDVEDLTEAELKILHAHYQRLAEMAGDEVDMTASHSVEEAENRHREKGQTGGQRTVGGVGSSSGAKKRETSSRA
jgi:low affinity Fe/Cu permease